MAINSPVIEFTTGVEYSFNSAQTGQSGGGIRGTRYAQDRYINNSSVANRTQTIGRATGTLAAAGTVTLDFTAFPLVDGSTGVFTKLACIYIQITSTTALGELTIGNAASNANGLWFGAATQTWKIYQGGPGFAGGNPVSASGITVDATHKNILLTNSGAVSIDYEVVAGGLTS